MPRLPYPKLAPDAYKALQSLGHYLRTATTLDAVLLALVDLRASQLNGCTFCIGMHTQELKHAHEPDSRIDAVANWRDSDAFTPREKAALAWTEEITNIQDGHAADEAYRAVSQYFKDKDLVDLTWAIAAMNAWNRMGIAFAAEWNPSIRPGSSPAKEEPATAAAGS
ncbi:MAG TPA: carboxymuconolactone decarboxylase family protein [Candidatus Aquilonibacter sp.]|nr:carboxymuconolactone decarboxylase family protein [Candidatus Aquilonibacter sp.]